MEGDRREGWKTAKSEYLNHLHKGFSTLIYSGMRTVCEGAFRWQNMIFSALGSVHCGFQIIGRPASTFHLLRDLGYFIIRTRPSFKVHNSRLSALT